MTTIAALQAGSKMELKEHFFHFYELCSKSKITKYANYYEDENELRSLTGINFPFYNIVYLKNEKGDLSTLIKSRMHTFHQRKLPFMWLVDENEQNHLREQLIQHKFVDVGILKGIMGPLEQQVDIGSLPNSYNIEKVSNYDQISELSLCMGKVFSMETGVVDNVTDVCWSLSKGWNSPMHSWMIRYEGQVVSTVSIFVQGDVASFWNGSTFNEHRNKGLCTHLAKIAANEAYNLGCTKICSYLMADGMARGICEKLGMETLWRFNAFLAP